MATISKPSRVDRACDRLTRAIARLESAARNAGGGGGGAAADVAELRRENDTLREANAQAKGRLDTAIERLEAALGE